MTCLTDEFHLPALDARDALARANDGAVLIDLRKPAAVIASGHRVVGAEIRDPFAFDHDDPLMGDPRPLITFCVHGHEVSQFACALLMLHGRTVNYVRGGYEALVQAGVARVEIGE